MQWSHSFQSGSDPLFQAEWRLGVGKWIQEEPPMETMRTTTRHKTQNKGASKHTKPSLGVCPSFLLCGATTGPKNWVCVF